MTEMEKEDREAKLRLNMVVTNELEKKTCAIMRFYDQENAVSFLKLLIPLEEKQVEQLLIKVEGGEVASLAVNQFCIHVSLENHDSQRGNLQDS